jgi:hypothetical protein
MRVLFLLHSSICKYYVAIYLIILNYGKLPYISVTSNITYLIYGYVRLKDCKKKTFDFLIVVCSMAHKEEKRNVCRVFGGKPERKRLLGRSRHGKEDNIEMNLKGIG